jgi:hypothetical protein
VQPLGENVFYESVSTHKWRDLNETLFLERVIEELRARMRRAFLDHTFFILSTRDGRVRPESISHPSQRKVLIVISDESGSIPTDLGPHYLAIFKGYLPRELPGTNIYPFNIGYVRDVPALPVIPVDERTIDVFFSGNLSVSRLPMYRALSPVYRRLPDAVSRQALALTRRRGLGWLMKLDLSARIPRSHLRFTRAFATGISPADYAAALAASRVALCPMGASSAETFRHIEAMRAGAVLVSEPLPDTHFYRGAPVVTVDHWDTGIEHARRLLSDPARLRELQRETIAWWANVCSEAATARYVAERLAQLA